MFVSKKRRGAFQHVGRAVPLRGLSSNLRGRGEVFLVLGGVHQDLCPNKRRRGGSRERSEPAPGATTRCGRGSRRREEPRGEHLATGGRDVEAGANEGEAPGRDGLAGEQPWPERRRRQWAWARPAAPWAQTRAADWSEQHWPKRRRRPRACAETKAAARGSDDGTRAATLVGAKAETTGCVCEGAEEEPAGSRPGLLVRVCAV